MHLVADRLEFDEARNTRVFVCGRVRDGAPVLWVSHDEDGEWQFLCGGDHSNPATGDEGYLSCLECAVARDPSLNEMADLDCGKSAVRDEVGGAWDVFENPSESEDRTGGRHDG